MVKVKVKQSLYSPAGSAGGEGLDIPRFQDSRHVKLVRLSDLRISCRSAYGEMTFRRFKASIKQINDDDDDDGNNNNNNNNNIDSCGGGVRIFRAPV